MGIHPLIELAHSREVRQASGFRAVAAELRGETLREEYEREVAAAPRRHEAGKKYFVAPNARLISARRPDRDDEHLALALLRHVREGGELSLPEGTGGLELFHALVPLRSTQVDKSKGDADPNLGVDKIHLLGATPEGQLVVGLVKYAAPSATRCSTGDTPLRGLLEGLANCAIAHANRAALEEEISARSPRELADEPPIFLFAATPRYWELCRRREAQKGAAWIKEMERLASEIEDAIGVAVHYLSLHVDGDPGWEYRDGSPALLSPPKLAPAWEAGAGRVKPKPRPRPKASEPQEMIVEADLSRPVRDYAITESYEAGERIQHSTLGLGVVQGPAGPGKIFVLFDDKRSLLVHERG